MRKGDKLCLVVRDVECGQTGGAEDRHQQHELKIGHAGTMEIERLHARLPLVLFSEVGVDVEERVDAFEQSGFDFVRRAVNDV